MSRRYLALIALLVSGAAFAGTTSDSAQTAPKASAPGGRPSARPATRPGLVVHEWGTFLAMQTSDGVTLDGMYHEEHGLPTFVHSRSRDQLRMPKVILKGETPVIYFYTEAPQSVTVSVDFPRGIWTQWYPQAWLVTPRLEQTDSPPRLRNGRITWRVDLEPAGAGGEGRGARGEKRGVWNEGAGKAAPVLVTAPKGALWNYSRDVDAAYVRVVDRTTTPTRHEVERFLFYRGLGEASLPLEMTAEGGGTLRWGPSDTPPARHLFIVRVEKGRAAYSYLSSLAPGQSVRGVIPSMDGAKPVAARAREIGDELASRLRECGLYPKEARAMVNTWSESYFSTEGTRVLFVLPQAWTDRFIPLNIVPPPSTTVRVMVGRLEMLSPEREAAAAEAVARLASGNAGERERAFEFLRSQGRYVEPILRRIQRTTKDEGVRTLSTRLLLTDFVTELRSALQPATGGPLPSDEPYARAQLASLLREVGLGQEAKAEADRALAALRKMPPPDTTKSVARHYLRAYARSMEGLGDDRAAAAGYEKFVRFGSQVKRCGGCHSSEGPRNMAWFRDWWVGRRYARYVSLLGERDQAIRRYEDALKAQPGDTGVQMLLAYLYEANRDTKRSAALWAAVATPERRAGR